MKKILLILTMIMVMTVAFVGCGTKQTSKADNNSTLKTVKANAGEEKDSKIKYMGTWYINGDAIYSGEHEKELRITEIDDDKVIFTLNFYRVASIDNVRATFKGNIAKFNGDIEDKPVSGTLEFNNNGILVSIDKSEFEYIKPGKLDFNSKANNVVKSDYINEIRNDEVTNSNGKKEVNQKDSKEVVNAYFKFIEKKDYEKAWELTSDKAKKSYSKESAINEHWGIVSLKIISVKKEESLKIDKEQYKNRALYTVVFKIKPSSGTAWNDGENSRFVNLIKQNDGKWYVDALSTGP